MPVYTNDALNVLGTIDGLEAAVGQMPGSYHRSPLGPRPREYRSRDWVFTWNNYNPAEEIVLGNIGLTRDDTFQYLVFGRETGESGTPHLQGFIQFKSAVALGQVQRFLCPTDRRTRIHVEPRRGTPAEAATYCKKENDFEEYGRIDLRDQQGRRNDLADFIQATRDGGPLSTLDMIDRFPMVLARYPKFVELVNSTYEEAPDIPMHPLRGWQADLGIQLRLNPDPRKIFFVVDVVGNAGKSWFVDYWTHLHSNCLVMHPAKHADMALVLKQCRPKPKTVFIDCPREKLDFFSYTFLEDLKNGRVFSTKYESVMVKMRVPHVVMMMNEDPDLRKLSRDRYELIRIG